MKYIAIDTETTGLDRLNSSIIMMSLIFVDTRDANPKESALRLTFMIDRDPQDLVWEEKALEMNQWIVDSLNGVNQTKYQILSMDEIMPAIERSLIASGYEKGDNGKYVVNLAGANIDDFDLPIIKRDIEGFEDLIDVNRRRLDPSILFLDYDNDKTLPGLSKNLKRSNMGDVVSHDSEEDALQVVDLLEYHRTVISPMILGLMSKRDSVVICGVDKAAGFLKEVNSEDLEKEAKSIYAEYKGYEFIKCLWVQTPNEEDKRLVELVNP